MHFKFQKYPYFTGIKNIYTSQIPKICRYFLSVNIFHVSIIFKYQYFSGIKNMNTFQVSKISILFRYQKYQNFSGIKNINNFQVSKISMLLSIRSIQHLSVQTTEFSPVIWSWLTPIWNGKGYAGDLWEIFTTSSIDECPGSLKFKLPAGPAMPSSCNTLF